MTTPPRILLITMCLAVLLAQVDTSVVNLAIRSIGAQFGAAVDGLQWVLDAYNLAYAVLLLTGGLVADLYGRRRVFIAGVAVFTAGSVLCAVAPSVAVLIAARTLTGGGAALLLPASLAIIRMEWRADDARNRALGVWAACNGLAFVIGPTVGGVLVEAFGWRSVFLIAVPLGLTALGLALGVVPESRNPAGRQFDGVGQICGAAALAGLALAGISAASDGVVAVAALVVAAVSFLAFLQTERKRGAAAMVPLDLFRTRAFTGALAVTAAMTFGMYGLLFLVPLVWQSTGILTAAQAGLAMTPMAAVFFAVSNLSGRVTETIGTRGPIAGGTASIGFGLLVLGLTHAGQPFWLAQAGLLLAGLGMGLNTAPLFGVAVASVASARSGSAASLINVARMIGATLGVAVLGTAFAVAGAGAPGLRVAMCLGGTVQLAGAAAGALMIRRG